MRSITYVPGTHCHTLKDGPTVDGGHYVYKSMRATKGDWGPARSWGYCCNCDKIVTYTEYKISRGVYIYAWTDYHYPIIEWP